MKKLFAALFCLFQLSAMAQVTPLPPTGNEPIMRFGQLPEPTNRCDTRPRKPLKPIPSAEMARVAQKAGALPYSIKVYLTVFADNDGSNRASTDADQLRQFNAMVEQYRPHSICFVLMGLREVRNSDLNIQDKSEEDELEPFLIPGGLNLFTHAVVQNSDGMLGGTAYDIPNTGAYASLSGTNIGSPNDVVTMSHEVGHVLGLFHTFENHPFDPLHDTESVERNRDASCWDCDVDGDYICDTPADPDQDGEDRYLQNNTTSLSANCAYTGNRRDECGVLYTPTTNNFMSYGRFACLNTVTVGQGTRMRYFLANETDFAPILTPQTAAAPFSFPYSILLTNGSILDVSRDLFTLGELGPYQVQQSANVVIVSKRIVLRPGVRFSPGAGGRVQLTNNPNCD